MNRIEVQAAAKAYVDAFAARPHTARDHDFFPPYPNGDAGDEAKNEWRKNWFLYRSFITKLLHSDVADWVDQLKGEGYSVNDSWHDGGVSIYIDNPWAKSEKDSWGVGLTRKYLGRVNIEWRHASSFKNPGEKVSIEYQFVRTTGIGYRERMRRVMSVAALLKKAREDLYMPTEDEYNASVAAKSEEKKKSANNARRGEIRYKLESRLIRVFEVLEQSNVQIPDDLKEAFNLYLEYKELS